ncbi:hypothetical protein HOLleu_25355 [Holothuria leucospilota]|uniref:Uncharacterized protein n=1 Tax=Holothuria leucospilota TaxID=206669 RepID=A0A9Q1BSW4_HOLLE|nr:hypothetical protein HOLleu_25355 [Holothuria leucospilota]
MSVRAFPNLYSRGFRPLPWLRSGTRADESRLQRAPTGRLSQNMAIQSRLRFLSSKHPSQGSTLTYFTVC